MLRQISTALRVVVLLTVLTGIAYPLLVTVICQSVFPKQANGSMIAVNGKLVGSELIGQEEDNPRYFHSRPSAAGKGYDATASGGSNFGPISQKLADRVKDSVAKFRAENPGYSGPIPADLVTASGSGLDPEISPASAHVQAVRVATLRRLDVTDVEHLIAARVESPSLGLIGEPRINVLKLNLALDQLKTR